MHTGHYRAVSPKSTIGGSIEDEKGMKKKRKRRKKRKEKRRRREKYLLARVIAISICIARYGWYIPVRGPPTIGGYRQNRPSAIDFGRRRSIKGEIDRRRSIEGEKGKKKKRKRRKNKKEVPHVVLARAPSPARGSLASRRRPSP
ncbi:hypothetical protein GW17_00026885 [Ensete ventricosum]|nr:hypothetical protein GW17_00026885 [Ensete ventricosum]